MEKKYNIKRFKVNGESGDIPGESVDSWKERLPEMVITKMMFGMWMDYRHFKKKNVLSKIDECSTATDVVKSVNIPIAVRWVPRLSPWLRQKTFKKAGILDSSMDMVTRDEEDPFLDADELALQDYGKNNEWSRQLHAGGVCKW